MPRRIRPCPPPPRRALLASSDDSVDFVAHDAGAIAVNLASVLLARAAQGEHEFAVSRRARRCHIQTALI